MSAEKAKKDNKGNALERFLKRLIPWKGDSVGEVIRKLVLIFSIAVIIVCGIYFYNRFSQRREYMDTTKLSGLVEDSDTPAEKGNEKEKFKDLIERNSDFVGWLKIDGTSIDVPIVQTNDNETYLRKSFYGNYSVYGNPFLDYRNKVNRLFTEDTLLTSKDRNTVIYGHNMLDNLVFSELLNYKELSYYKEHPVIDFDTVYGDSKWIIISCFLVNSTADMDNGYAIEYNFVNCEEERFMPYIEDIKKRSYINTGVDVNQSDVLLTLSTCDKKVIKEGRFVVVARLVRNGEDEQFDVSKASLNKNIKFPQGYCDKKGIKNNYAGDAEWTPYSEETKR